MNRVVNELVYEIGRNTRGLTSYYKNLLYPEPKRGHTAEEQVLLSANAVLGFFIIYPTFLVTYPIAFLEPFIETPIRAVMPHEKNYQTRCDINHRNEFYFVEVPRRYLSPDKFL